MFLGSVAVAILVCIGDAVQIGQNRQGNLRAASHSNVSVVVDVDALRIPEQTEWAFLPIQASQEDNTSRLALNSTQLLNTFVVSASQTHNQADAGHAYLQRHDSRPGPSLQSAGRIFFLFMTMTGLHHQSHWQAFFEGVDRSKYRLMLHCKQYNNCVQALANNNPLGLSMVFTVASHYCVDLVSPMVQLLRSAIKESASPHDKFVFVSESTLPAKPFSIIYSDLMLHQQSDICVGPSDDWLGLTLRQNFPPYSAERAYLVKHSQWVILSPDHAREMITNWNKVKQGDWPDTSWSVPIWHAPEARNSNSSTPSKLPTGDIFKEVRVCADEWAIFATLYGAVVDSGNRKVTVPGFSTNMLQLHGTAVQGVCRTFVYWGQERYHYYSQDGSQLVRQITADQETVITCAERCTGSHPGAFIMVSNTSAAAIRRSTFLFVRKFDRDSLSVEQFRRFILAPVPG